jgi:serine/threonine protein kinase
MHAPRWQRLSELFDAAFDLPEDERAGFVARLRDDDAALADELGRLLAADAGAEGFLEPPVAPETVQRFGAYRLLRPLGHGGMGEVYLAERADGVFEQRVALKLLPHPTPGMVQRFERERRILARLEHPNIARLLDGGLAEHGIPYFAMEFVDGVPITHYVRDRVLDVAATLRLFLPVCAAVQCAHRNLVVHRDLKPSNILVDADGAPKLLDFGIAKLLQATDPAAAMRTATRAYTPDYAAPEQIRGGTITTATDVYALGVVLHELLAGRRPYSLGDGVAPEQAVLAAEPAPPSAESGDPARRRALRGDLDRIVLTALAKEPERRYASVEALAADLRAHLDGRPVAARGDSTFYTLRKFARRNRVAVGLGTAAALAMVAATAFSLRQAHLANAEAASARASQKFMLNVFTQAEPWKNAGHQPTALELAKASMGKIDVELADQPLARADMYLGLNRLFSVADDIRLSVVAGQRAVAALEQMPDQDPDRLQHARASLAYSLYYNDNFAGADALITQLEARNDTTALTRYSLLALRRSMQRDRGEREDDVRLAREVCAMAKRIGRNDPGEIAANLWHLADAEDRLGDYRAAVAAYREFEASQSRIHPADSPARNSDIVWLLHMGAELDAPRATIDPYARALVRQRRMFGDSEYTWQALVLAARAARLAHRDAAALAWSDQARTMLRGLHAGPGEIADTESETGLILLDRGLLDRGDAQASAHLQTAADNYATLGGMHDPRALAMRAALAHARVREAPDAARAELRTILVEQRQRHLRELPETAMWLAPELGAPESATVLREGLHALDAQGRSIGATALQLHRQLAHVLVDAGDAHAESIAAAAVAITLYGEDDPLTAELLHQPDSGTWLQAARERAAKFDRPGLQLVELATRALAAAEAADATSAPKPDSVRP